MEKWYRWIPKVSWIWEPVDGQRDNIAVYHPIYGQSFPNMAFRDRVVFLHNDLKIPSIRINALRMSDAGRYTCEYATYPSGNEQGTTTLIMLGSNFQLNHPYMGNHMRTNFLGVMAGNGQELGQKI
ncbi:hypothetical protein ILYODFUR_021015 [Ilyodon furcidens]|uniref:Immunoglobulin V-set domain-containing protein n=1 Tax=Ilyodon furcidens TaxID=33524 RepID=A0ABV0SQ80_9TELE